MMDAAMRAATGAILKPGSEAAEAAAPGRQSASDYLAKIKESLGETWLPHLYRERILTTRTRSHKLFAATKQSSVEVQHTLLGVELKVGRRRLLCPDLATARYLAVFARAGCTEVAVPYDITRISLFADELESSWHRMLLLIEHLAGERQASFRSRLRSLLVGKVRDEIEEAGAGTAIPQFNQNTRQRRK
jgi:hypothetical protein